MAKEEETTIPTKIDKIVTLANKSTGQHILRGNTYTGMLRELFADWTEFNLITSFSIASPTLSRDKRSLDGLRVFSITLHPPLDRPDENDIQFQYVFTDHQPPMAIRYDKNTPDNLPQKTTINTTETLDNLAAILDIIPYLSLDKQGNLINRKVASLIDKVSQKVALLTFDPKAIQMPIESLNQYSMIPIQEQTKYSNSFITGVSLNHVIGVRVYLHPTNFPLSAGKYLILSFEENVPPWYQDQEQVPTEEEPKTNITQPASIKQLHNFNLLLDKALRLHYQNFSDKNIQILPYQLSTFI